MVGAGWTKLLILQHAGILSVEKFVNAQLCRVSSLSVMVINTVKLRGHSAVKLTMEAVGKALSKAEPTLLASMTTPKVASVHQGLKETELTVVKMLMNAKRRQRANVLTVNARIHGAATSVVAVVICST
jgi:hypothetical protein